MITSELPIYRKTYQLISMLYDLTFRFPKAYKYSIGEKINKESIELFEYISLANRDKANRKYHLEQVLFGATVDIAEKFCNTYNSYLGFMKSRKSYAIKREVWNELSDNLRECCYIKGKFKKLSLKNEWREIKVKRKEIKQERGNKVYYFDEINLYL